MISWKFKVHIYAIPLISNNHNQIKFDKTIIDP